MSAPAKAKSRVLGLLALAWAVTLCAGQPYIPVDDTAVVEQLPAGQTREGDDITVLRTRLAADPANAATAFDLALAYIRLGQAESDPRYYGYARAALNPWWDQPEPPVRLQLLRAVIRQALHDFGPALADFEAILNRDPRNAQARLSRAVVLMVQGRPREALAGCLGLTRLTDPLLAASCSAGAAGRIGKADQALALLERSLARPGGDPVTRLWALTVQGELAQALGRLELAEAAFRRALAMGSRDTYLLGAYADLLLDQDRPGEVLKLLAGETRVDGLLLRLALAEARLDHPDLETHLTLIQDRMTAASRRGSSLHLREAARATLHLLDDPVGALELALENWQTQREPWDARLVLEAALAANVPQAAGPVLEWLEDTGLEDRAITPLQRRLEAMSGHGDA